MPQTPSPFFSMLKRVQASMHSQLRNDENICGECLKKEKYGETGHREGSWLDSPLDVETVSHHFDDEQKGGRRGSHEKE